MNISKWLYLKIWALYKYDQMIRRFWRWAFRRSA